MVPEVIDITIYRGHLNASVIVCFNSKKNIIGTIFIFGYLKFRSRRQVTNPFRSCFVNNLRLLCINTCRQRLVFI